MCWYSAEHLGREIQQAEVGQRLAIRKMHWDSTRWVIQENELQQERPAPVCVLDGTQVVFRPTETEQSVLQCGAEPSARFRMLRRPDRDIFEFEDGRQIELNHLPHGLLFDVLVVPGKEQLSTLVTMQSESEPEVEPEREKEEEPLLARLLRIW